MICDAELIRARDLLRDLTDAELRVWFYYRSRANMDGLAWPSVKLTCSETGLYDDTVSAAKTSLIAKRWLLPQGPWKPRSSKQKFRVVVPESPGANTVPVETRYRAKDGTGPGPNTGVGPGPKPGRSNKEPLKKKPQEEIHLPDWLPLENWEGFLEMRRTIRAPLTVRAMTLVIKTLGDLREQGNDPAAVLDRSILNNWKDVYELRSTNGKQIKGAGPGGSMGRAENHLVPQAEAALQQLRERRSDSDGADSTGKLDEGDTGGRLAPSVRGQLA